jgi:hypothetical protein
MLHLISAAATPILAQSDNNRKPVASEILFFPIYTGPGGNAE